MKYEKTICRMKVDSQAISLLEDNPNTLATWGDLSSAISIGSVTSVTPSVLQVEIQGSSDRVVVEENSHLSQQMDYRGSTFSFYLKALQ